MNTGVHVSLLVFSRHMPESSIAGSYGNSIFSFLTSILFPIVAVPIYIPTNSVGEFKGASVLITVIQLLRGRD